MQLSGISAPPRRTLRFFVGGRPQTAGSKRSVPTAKGQRVIEVGSAELEAKKKRKEEAAKDAALSRRGLIERYLGQLEPDGLRVIKDGLSPDDHVVIAGLMQARPGSKVRPQQQGAPAAGAPPQAAK